MKQTFLIFILCYLFTNSSSAQTLIEQIEQAYSALDSTAYIDEMIESYARSLENDEKDSYQLYLDLWGTPDDMGVRWGNEKVDSMYYDDLQEIKILHSQYLKDFENKLKSSSPVYLLKLKRKDDQTLQVDTGRLAFNIFCFDKKYKGSLYVYCNNGEYSWQDSRYITFSRKFGKNAPKAFRRIMRKQPKYLLYCTEWESMNAIFYLLNNEIYVHRIVPMKEYRLDDYLKEMNTRQASVSYNNK